MVDFLEPIPYLHLFQKRKIINPCPQSLTDSFPFALKAFIITSMSAKELGCFSEISLPTRQTGAVIFLFEPQNSKTLYRECHPPPLK